MTATKTRTVTNTYARPTDKQVAYAESLARKAGHRRLSDAFAAVGMTTHPVQGRTRADYSRLIDALKVSK